MKTYKYKTLRGLVRNSSQLNFNDFCAGVMWHNKRGWVRFTLPESEKMKGFSLLAGTIYANGDRFAKRLFFYDGQRYGIFNRLFFSNYGGKLGATYCAGQDYVAEIKLIQKLLRQ